MMDFSGLERTTHTEGTGRVPAFGRVGFRGKRIGSGDLSAEERIQGCTPDLAAQVEALARFAALEEQELLAEATSLRGGELVATLLALFEDQDEALAALEDYAGAFDDLTQFAGEVVAERFPLLPTSPDDVLAAYGAALVARGEVVRLAPW